MKLKKRIQYFFFPNNRIRDKINSLYHEAIVIMADNDPVSSTPSATRVALDKIQRIEKEIKKLELTYKYKGTGNRILLWLWGNYWVCLGVSFYCFVFYILLGLCYKHSFEYGNTLGVWKMDVEEPEET